MTWEGKSLSTEISPSQGAIEPVVDSMSGADLTALTAVGIGVIEELLE